MKDVAEPVPVGSKQWCVWNGPGILFTTGRSDEDVTMVGYIVVTRSIVGGRFAHSDSGCGQQQSGYLRKRFPDCRLIFSLELSPVGRKAGQAVCRKPGPAYGFMTQRSLSAWDCLCRPGFRVYTDNLHSGKRRHS